MSSEEAGEDHPRTQLDFEDRFHSKADCRRCLLALRRSGGSRVQPASARQLDAGLLFVVAGVIAVISGRPYAVYDPLLLGGGSSAVIPAALLPVARKRYRREAGVAS